MFLMLNAVINFIYYLSIGQLYRLENEDLNERLPCRLESLKLFRIYDHILITRLISIRISLS